MKKVLLVFGTRPEAIKMIPLVKEFHKFSRDFETKICVTAQHREMLDQVLAFFEVVPDFDLNLMKPGQNLYNLTADVLTGMKDVLEDFRPDYVLVHGDTSTSTAASLAAFYFGAKVCHIEAGLRTFDKHSPFPEEINRQITGRIADFHFAPTEEAKKNLLLENVKEDKIFVTGNTVIDALLYSVKEVNSHYINDEIIHLNAIIDLSSDLILVTGHRRENHGQGFLNICAALLEIAKEPNVQVIYPVHLNPNVLGPVSKLLANVNNIHIIPPLTYPSFVWLMDKSKIILTDSGGIQEEAPSLGKPVLVMRNTTERPEAVEAGTVILVGANKEKIVFETLKLLREKDYYTDMSHLHNPYGDGNSASKIVKIFKQI